MSGKMNLIVSGFLFFCAFCLMAGQAEDVLMQQIKMADENLKKAEEAITAAGIASTSTASAAAAAAEQKQNALESKYKATTDKYRATSALRSRLEASVKPLEKKIADAKTAGDSKLEADLTKQLASLNASIQPLKTSEGALQKQLLSLTEEVKKGEAAVKAAKNATRAKVKVTDTTAKK